MSKRKKAGKKDVAEEKTEKPRPKEEKPHEEDENPFDFGGLPKRDLKKNLGCG